MSAETEANGAGTTAIGLAIDDREMRRAVAEQLATGGYRVVAHIDGVGAIGAPLPTRVACLVAGCGRPESGVLAALRQARGNLGATPLVLVCERAGAGEIGRALSAGADAVVLRRDVSKALGPVIACSIAGQVTIPGGRRDELDTAVLTGREKEILGLVVLGMTNGEIGSRLFVAESTVKSHLSSAFRKLNVATRNEAVRLIVDPERGRSLGILSIPVEERASH